MTDDVPEEMMPDGQRVITDRRCPGCGDPLPPPSVPYGKAEYDGDTWHAECAFADADNVEKTDTPRYCGNCRGISKWRFVDGPKDARLCFTCLGEFHGPIRERPDGPPFDRTEGVDK
jgi:hypothetical protein